MRVLTNQRAENGSNYIAIVEIDENKLEKTLRLVRENDLACATISSTQKRVEDLDLINLIGDEEIVATKFAIDFQRTTLNVDTCEILEQRLQQVSIDFDVKTDMPCAITEYANGNVALRGYLNNICGDFNEFGELGQKTLRNYV
jgi:hypothetical protein